MTARILATEILDRWWRRRQFWSPDARTFEIRWADCWATLPHCPRPWRAVPTRSSRPLESKRRESCRIRDREIWLSWCCQRSRADETEKRGKKTDWLIKWLINWLIDWFINQNLVVFTIEKFVCYDVVNDRELMRLERGNQDGMINWVIYWLIDRLESISNDLYILQYVYQNDQLRLTRKLDNLSYLYEPWKHLRRI